MGRKSEKEAIKAQFKINYYCSLWRLDLHIRLYKFSQAVQLFITDIQTMTVLSWLVTGASVTRLEAGLLPGVLRLYTTNVLLNRYTAMTLSPEPWYKNREGIIGIGQRI
jgi:hypothetical protein